MKGLTLPDEVAEAKDEDGDAGEFDHVRQVRFEILDIVWKHGRQGKRTEALGERDARRRRDTEPFPQRTPVPARRVSHADHSRMRRDGDD